MIKFRSMTSVGGEVKPSVPCREILRHVIKYHTSIKKIFRRQNSRPFLAKFLPLRYYMSLPVIDRELWWVNREWELRLGRTTDRKLSHCMGRLVGYHPVTTTVRPNSNGSLNMKTSFRLFIDACSSGKDQKRGRCRDNKYACSNYRGISLVPTLYT
jgi:hypothetical protein